MPSFPDKESLINLSGPCGNIESIASPAREPASNKILVVCHPHPLMEGTMHNKVSHTIARAGVQSGCDTVRFNFRGVGASDGEYADGVGEVEDLIAVVQWLREQRPGHELILAGFSFGSYIAASATMQLSEQGVDVSHLICVAPPVGRFDFEPFTAFPCALTVVQGDEDEVVSAEVVYRWAEGLSEAEGAVKLHRFADTTHFFHRKLTDLKEVLLPF